MCLFCCQFYIPLVSCIGDWMLDVFVLRSILNSFSQLYWLLDVRGVCFVVNFIFLWSVVLAIGC